jgi:hypothetical protein
MKPKYAFHITLTCSSDPDKDLSTYGIVGRGAVHKYPGGGRTPREFLSRLRTKFDTILRDMERSFETCGEGCSPF